MPFYNNNFLHRILLMEKVCNLCGKEFGEFNQFTGEILKGEVAQCTKYKEYCIGCCP